MTPEFTISQIHPGDKRAVAQMNELLQKEGIDRDQNLDYSVGLYDDDYRLAATGSCYQNTLRCLAVDSSHQGEGLLNKLVSHLIEYQCGRGFTDLFLYAKCAAAPFLKDLGFYEITRVDDRLVFMENRKNGFSNYLAHLRLETHHFQDHRRSRLPLPSSPLQSESTAAVVINANPFTLGHQYLLETAAAHCGLLHVFIVSEDVSLIPFSTRQTLVKAGSSHLPNLVYHHTGDYMISNATFPSYFLKDREAINEAHAKLDAAIFIQIARALDITRRYAGEEPLSQATRIYNQVLSSSLQPAGITFTILPRLQENQRPISASTAREYLRQGDLKAFKRLVPATTYAYFQTIEGTALIKNS